MRIIPFVRLPLKGFWLWQSIVRNLVFHSLLLTVATVLVAELRDTVLEAIPGIVKCLKDMHREVRQVAIEGLSNLANHGMCYHYSMVGHLIHSYSYIA